MASASQNVATSKRDRIEKALAARQRVQNSGGAPVTKKSKGGEGSKQPTAHEKKSKPQSAVSKRKVAVPESDEDKPETDEDKPSHLPPRVALRNGKAKKGAESSEESSDESNESDNGDASSANEGGDDELSGLTDEQLRDMLEAESVVILGDKPKESAAGLFSIPDNDVEMVSRLQSEVKDEVDNAMDTDSGAEERVGEKKHLKSARKPKEHKTGARQPAFEAEQPIIKTEGKRSHSKSKVSAMSKTSGESNDSCWPSALIIQGSGKQLNQQTGLVQAIVHAAIDAELPKILYEDAWPVIGNRDEYCKDIMLSAAQSHLGRTNGTKEFIRRLNAEPDFGRTLGAIVTDRFSSTRSPAKSFAIRQIAAYELGIGEKCKARVQALIEGDGYVLPGKWNDNNVWSGKNNMPYQNPAIIETMKAAFFTGKAPRGVVAAERFNKVRDPASKLKPILPPALLALAATSVTLLEWEEGKHSVGKQFEGNIHSTVYRRHLATIEGIEEDSKAAYIAIMSRLLEEVTAESTKLHRPSAGTIRGKFDLSGYDGYDEQA